MHVSIIYENRFIRELKNNKIKYSEEFAKEILKDPQLTKKTVFVLGNLLMLERVVYASGIDKAGNVLLGLARDLGYYICLLMCIMEIIKSLMQGDTKSIGKIIMKYIIAFGAFYMLPWLFNIIKDSFK